MIGGRSSASDPSILSQARYVAGLNSSMLRDIRRSKPWM
jgi:hypothetical protein